MNAKFSNAINVLKQINELISFYIEFKFFETIIFIVEFSISLNLKLVKFDILFYN